MAQKCSHCDAINPDTMKFCGICGKELIRKPDPKPAPKLEMKPVPKSAPKTETKPELPPKEKRRKRKIVKIIAIVTIVAIASIFGAYVYLLSQTIIGIQVFNDYANNRTAIGIYLDGERIAVQEINPGANYHLSLPVSPGYHIVEVERSLYGPSGLDGAPDKAMTTYANLGGWRSVVVHFP